MAFLKAEKGKKPLRVVIGGASGSGKSYTSLLFGKLLSEKTGKRTCAVDTEHGRLSLYADLFDFDVIEFEPPFHPNNLIKLIHEAEEAGYGQMIVDSSSHFYNGTGGLLEIVADAAKSKFGGNQYYAWAVGSPIHNNLVDAIIRSPMHIIVTARAKQTYVEQEKGGKKTYEKQGYDIIQKDSLEYELDFSMMMDMENNGLIMKGMGNVPPGTYFKKPGKDAIQAIMDAIEKDSVMLAPKVTLESLKKEVIEMCTEKGGSSNDALMVIVNKYGNPKSIKTIGELESLKKELENMKE
jgi:energy-coupling factor transporter ATP-binding protein EcfA2